MTIWTKISGSALSLGGSLASLMDWLKGKGPGPQDPERSVAFTVGVIALGAKMAKADGVVTEGEIAAFREVFRVDADEIANVARVFNLAKKDVAGYETYAHQLAKLFGDQPEVLEDVMDGLFHIAKAEGAVTDSELAYLKSVADIFGLSQRFRCIKARHIEAAEDDPYVILDIEPCASDEEVRRYFRRLVKENHPDRHVAAGLPPEMVTIATERLAAINAAWEAVRRERGL
jgi:DnaJ like chaperone protein